MPTPNTEPAEPIIDYNNLPIPEERKPGKRKAGAAKISIEAMIDLRRRGLSNVQIGELLGCHNSTVSKRLNKLSHDIDITDHYIKHRPWLLAYEQHRIRQSITATDIAKAGLRDKVVAIGILHDHELKAAGLPTQIILYADGVKMRQQLIQERKDLEAEVQANNDNV
jgi:hypothetical protein